MDTLLQNKTPVFSKNLFPVVGVGASAGGLEAFKKLVKAIPQNSGMAFILVQHLHPEHSSSLPEILQRETTIPVNEISDNVEVKPNQLYIIPANKLLVAGDGILQLSPRLSKEHINMPIDILFSSLAEIHQSHAIGIVLSGTGEDGTLGLKNIKEQGGITFAQDIESAAYDAMPQSAINAEVVDFILSPEKMPQQLLELNRTYNILPQNDHATPEQLTEEGSFKKILDLLRIRNGVDFTYYKQTTVRRRILRRMVIIKLEKFVDYLEYLKQNKDEQDILFQDMLIPVTAFFRDPKTFENLCETVFPELIKNKSSINPLRIWIAGCSTGEEAYSIGMSLHEFLSDKISGVKIQIFATDISEKVIAKARSGLYNKRELEGVPEAKLKQFFTKVDGSYQVKKNIRDICVFAVHNFLKDTPFAKMDLICCRNVLIYMEPFLQKKAFTTFHYALNEKGYLLLGKSETTGSASDLYLPLGKKEKLYTRKTIPGRFMNVASERSEEVIKDEDYGLRSDERKKDDFQKNADDILLSKYTPAGVIVNEQLDIVQFRGSVREFLEPASGKASLSVLKMAREGLAFELRNALHKAKSTNEPFSKDGILINDGKKLITIEVIPLLNTIDPHFLILFKDSGPATGNLSAGGGHQQLPVSDIKDEKSIRIEKLEKDLLRAREDMRSITEDQEAVNEELQSANEELLSGSEELQSLNEELETSKEELQSTNEELITVNQELYDRNEQLNEARFYAEAIVTTIHEPLLVLSHDFKIKSANKSFYKNFSIAEEETIGKILFDLQNNGWDIPGLRSQLLRIQTENEKFLEWEVTYTFPLAGERTICFNAQPFQKENTKNWILLAMEDITKIATARKKIEESNKRYNIILMQSPFAFSIMKGKDMVITVANDLMKAFWGKGMKVEGKPLLEVLPELRDQPFPGMIQSVYVTGNPVYADEILARLEHKGKMEEKYFNIIYQPYLEADETISGVITVAHEVTNQVVARKKMEVQNLLFQDMLMTAPGFVATLVGPDHVYELVNEQYQSLFGKRKIQGKPIMVALPELEGQGIDLLLDEVYNSGKSYVGIDIPRTLARDEGLPPEERYFNFSYQPMFDENRKIYSILVFGYEVTEQMAAKKRIEQSESHFRQMSELMPAKITNADAGGGATYYNKKWLDYTGMKFEKLRNFGYHNIMHPDELEEFKKRFQLAAETGTDLEMEIRFRNKEGEYKWHLNRASPVKDSNGIIKMWIGVTTDIHDQKTKEAAKDEFIGIASHELKTPLTTAKAYIHLLEMGMEKQNNKDLLYAQKASASIDRLNNLIGELLDVSKIQSGKLALDITSFNFDDMISAAIEDIQHTSLNHKIIKSGQTNTAVSGDMERLKQVVINLLTNAVKYSPESDMVLVNVVQENGEITVSVKDSGIGIRKENIGKIFERYYREEERSPRFQGLGIGLSICSGIIQRHKGKIWVESEPGIGSTFYFTIPV